MHGLLCSAKREVGGLVGCEAHPESLEAQLSHKLKVGFPRFEAQLVARYVGV